MKAVKDALITEGGIVSSEQREFDSRCNSEKSKIEEVPTPPLTPDCWKVKRQNPGDEAGAGGWSTNRYSEALRVVCTYL